MSWGNVLGKVYWRIVSVFWNSTNLDKIILTLKGCTNNSIKGAVKIYDIIFSTFPPIMESPSYLFDVPSNI